MYNSQKLPFLNTVSYFSKLLHKLNFSVFKTMRWEVALVTLLLPTVTFPTAAQGDETLPEVVLRFDRPENSTCRSDSSGLRFLVSWWHLTPAGQSRRLDQVRVRVQPRFGPELPLECQAFKCINPRNRIRAEVRLEDGKLLCRSTERRLSVTYHFGDPQQCRDVVAECLPGHARQ